MTGILDRCSFFLLLLLLVQNNQQIPIFVAVKERESENGKSKISLILDGVYHYLFIRFCQTGVGKQQV